MKQPSQISGSIIADKIIVLIIMFLVLTLLSLGYARDSSNNFAFNGLNGISTKSDSMFYNDTNPANGKPPAPFTAAVGRKLSDGIEVTVAGSQYPVKLIPLSLSQGTGTRTGNRITYVVAPGVHIIYTFKGNGVKEDIVFDHPSASLVDLAFRLELDPMLEARFDGKGNVVIYGPNSILSGFIQTGDAKSAELILKARQHAPKDNLLYIIPAPIVIDGAGMKHKNIAHYTLEKSILTVHANGLAHLLAPVSIDPSIVVTTTADFMTGNNEGMISFDTDAISRAVPSGGSIANWTATTSFPTARDVHTSVAYDGYLYVLGGYNGSLLNDVQFAPINANGTVGTWTATTSFPTARDVHTSVAYNGYLYVLGGWNGSTYLNDVQFAPINANGTVGAWTATTSFPTARYWHTSVAYNGYLYVIGGWNGSIYLNDVQFAPINTNGTVGAWTATTSFPTARYWHTSVAYNGYLYVIGGSNGSNLNDIQFAPINANGTIAAWNTTTSFTTARYGHTSVAYNGYLYVIGGYNGTTYFNDVQFARLNGPASHARYSKLLDLGSDQVVAYINFSNSGAKGITNLTYAVAPSSTAVFGTRTMIPGALPTIDYTTNLNVCGRYMWVHFDLDDILSATIDSGGLNGRGNLLDFTVDYNALEGIHTSLRASKSSPNIHLSWGGSQNATSYNVLRCNAALPPCTPAIIASPTANSYDDPVLADSSNYWYRIQSVNGACVEGVGPGH